MSAPSTSSFSVITVTCYGRKIWLFYLFWQFIKPPPAPPPPARPQNWRLLRSLWLGTCSRTLAQNESAENATLFPGFSPTRPTEQERERPWKTLVTCLPASVLSLFIPFPVVFHVALVYNYFYLWFSHAELLRLQMVQVYLARLPAVRQTLKSLI